MVDGDQLASLRAGQCARVCVCCFGRPVCITKGPCRCRRMVAPASARAIQPFPEVIRRRASGTGVIAADGHPAPADGGRHHHKRPHGAVEVQQASTTVGPRAALQFSPSSANTAGGARKKNAS